MTIWCGFVLAGLVAALTARSPAALVPLSMLVLGGWFGYRMFNLAVVATPGELVVRNYVSTRRGPKEQLEGFRPRAPSTGPFGKGGVALGRDDTVVSLDATARPLPRFGGGRAGERAPPGP